VIRATEAPAVVMPQGLVNRVRKILHLATLARRARPSVIELAERCDCTRALVVMALRQIDGGGER
jgi:DNA-binding MarR family transcriptional regulator